MFPDTAIPGGHLRSSGRREEASVLGRDGAPRWQSLLCVAFAVTAALAMFYCQFDLYVAAAFALGVSGLARRLLARLFFRQLLAGFVFCREAS